MEESLVQNETMECHSAASAPEAVNLKFKNFLTKCAEQSFGVAGEIQRLKGIIGQLEGIPSDNDSQNATEELLNLKNLELLGYLGRLLTLMCCIMNGESIGGM
jgi:DNA polymerase/3'-5' exonuclease PolX